MTAIDATGIHAIETVAKRLRASGRAIILCGAMQQPSKLLRQPSFVEEVGPQNIMPNIQTTLDRANRSTANAFSSRPAELRQ